MKRLLILLLLFYSFACQGQIIRANGFYVAPVASVVDYNAEFDTVLAEFATPMHDTLKAKWNTFVNTLDTSGVWDTIDVMWVFAIHNGTDALINWITPGTYTATNNHSTSFTANEGFTGDAAADYIDLNWNPDANGVNFTLDEACFGVYNRTSTANDNYVETGGNDGTDYIYIQSEVASHHSYVSLNEDVNPGDFNISGDASGMKIAVRVSNLSLLLYDNKTQGSDTEGNTGEVNVDMFACAYNNNGSAGFYSGQQISLVFYGGLLSQRGINIITDAFETVMDSNGKGVIP